MESFLLGSFFIRLLRFCVIGGAMETQLVTLKSRDDRLKVPRSHFAASNVSTVGKVQTFCTLKV